MSTYARRSHDKLHIKLLLQWRWLVLAIAIPISLVIEILEGNSRGLHFLDEVIIDGLVLPMSTWIVLTFVARKIARQFEREEALEQRQQLMQRLAEHREYTDLTHFVVRFPSALLPIDHASLFVYDHQAAHLTYVTEWNAAGSGDSPSSRYLASMTVCSACLAAAGPAPRHSAACVFALDPPGADSAPEYCLPLAHNGALVGVLRLRCQPRKTPPAERLDLVRSLMPEVAFALEQALESARQAQQIYREAQIQERRRITHELHDTLAQQLFYLHLGLDQLADNQALLTSAAIQRKVETMRDVAAEVYEQVRNNLSILRAWEHADLTEAISRLARVTVHTADLALEIDVQGEPIWLSPHTCEDIYGIIREALNNIVKHAQARQVQLALIWSPDALRITITDDGVGFDPADQPTAGHYGLALMGEVVEALDGKLDLESAPGHGTRLHVTIPLRQLTPDYSGSMPGLRHHLPPEGVLQGM